MTTPTNVPCPQCKTPVRWGPDSPDRPFCSERCKLIDLGQWADEQYRVPATPDLPFDEHPD